MVGKRRKKYSSRWGKSRKYLVEKVDVIIREKNHAGQHVEVTATKRKGYEVRINFPTK